MGTAVAAWQTHTAGATGWHGLVTAGQLQTFVLRFNSSLVNADMENVATPLRVRMGLLTHSAWGYPSRAMPASWPGGLGGWRRCASAFPAPGHVLLHLLSLVRDPLAHVAAGDRALQLHGRHGGFGDVYLE